MTGMPELIALFHSFVGLTAVLVGWNGALHSGDLSPDLVGVPQSRGIHRHLHWCGDLTGSIVAYLKLSAKMSSKPLILPGRNSAEPICLDWFHRSHRCLRDHARDGLLDRSDHFGSGTWMAPSCLHWWWRHAGGGLDAQQLLRLGSGCNRLPA